MLLGFCLRLFSCVALIHVSQLDVLARGLLDRASQHLYLLSILFVGRCYVQSEQVSQSIHRRMQLRARRQFLRHQADQLRRVLRGHAVLRLVLAQLQRVAVEKTLSLKPSARGRLRPTVWIRRAMDL